MNISSGRFVTFFFMMIISISAQAGWDITTKTYGGEVIPAPANVIGDSGTYQRPVRHSPTTERHTLSNGVISITPAKTGFTNYSIPITTTTGPKYNNSTGQYTFPTSLGPVSSYNVTITLTRKAFKSLRRSGTVLRMMNEKGDEANIRFRAQARYTIPNTMVLSGLDIKFLIDSKMIWIEFNDVSVVVDPTGFEEAFNNLNAKVK